MIFRCNKCGLELSNELAELTDVNNLNENDNEDFIRTGCYVFSDGDFFRESTGKIIINKSDLKNSKNHSEKKRLNGCCGLDGLDGLNKVCLNGHEIGTEYSDCWIPHCVILEIDLIRND